MSSGSWLWSAGLVLLKSGPVSQRRGTRAPRHVELFAQPFHPPGRMILSPCGHDIGHCRHCHRTVCTALALEVPRKCSTSKIRVEMVLVDIGNGGRAGLLCFGGLLPLIVQQSRGDQSLRHGTSSLLDLDVDGETWMMGLVVSLVGTNSNFRSSVQVNGRSSVKIRMKKPWMRRTSIVT